MSDLAIAMTDADVRPWQPDGNGLRLRFRLTPKASFDQVDGITMTGDGPAIAARVRAVPEQGAANAALERLVAGWLGLGRRAVAVTAGHRSRVKTVMVIGDPARLADTIDGLLQRNRPQVGR